MVCRKFIEDIQDLPDLRKGIAMASRQRKRRFERFKAEQLAVDCHISGSEKGSLRNISIGGAGVCSNAALQVGSSCVLGINTTERRYNILAEVVWAENPGSYACTLADLPVSIGLRFSEDSLEQSKDLVFALLNNY